MKECKKTTRYCKNTQQMKGSLLVFFHLCLVSVHFPGPSLTEMKLYKNFPSLVLFLGGAPNHLPNRRLCCVYCAGDKQFWHREWLHFALVTNVRAGDKHVENELSNFSWHTHSWLRATFKQSLSRYDCYAQVLTSEMGGSFHALIHTFEYATPTSYIP